MHNDWFKEASERWDGRGTIIKMPIFGKVEWRFLTYGAVATLVAGILAMSSPGKGQAPVSEPESKVSTESVENLPWENIYEWDLPIIDFEEPVES